MLLSNKIKLVEKKKEKESEVAAKEAKEKFNAARSGPLVWIDCEMTGLDVEKDQIIEVCCFVTDSNLNAINPEPYHAIISCPNKTLSSMDEWCTTHHTKSGLVEKVKKSKLSLADVDKELYQYVKNNCEEIYNRVGSKESTSKGLLSGNSIHADKAFLIRQLPSIFSLLSYRILDVSSISEAVKRWAPEIEKKKPAKKYSHLAQDDILESIEQMRYYKNSLFSSSHVCM